MSQPTYIMLLALLFTLSSWTADAAEVRLARSAAVPGNVVRLGDVVEGDISPELAMVELGLTPAAGIEKEVTAQQVRECMLLSGMKSSEVRVVGAPLVIVTRGIGIARVKTSTLKPVLSAGAEGVVMASAEEEVSDSTIEDLLRDYLTRHSSTTVEWKLEVNASPRQVQWLGAAKDLRVSGGQSPFLGRQMFLVQGTLEGKPSQIQLQVKVSGTRTVLAFARTLPAGTVITPQDVMLRELPHTTAPAAYVSDVQAVVGQEVTRASAEGAPIAIDATKPARLVKKGEQVSIRSIAAGVTITARGKALADGMLDEVIPVEPLESKDKLMARVTANKTVELYALGLPSGK